MTCANPLNNQQSKIRKYKLQTSNINRLQIATLPLCTNGRQTEPMYKHINWPHVVFIQNKNKQTLFKLPHKFFFAIRTNLLNSTHSIVFFLGGGNV